MPWPLRLMSRIRSVAAIAKTPSLNVSRRAVRSSRTSLGSGRVVLGRADPERDLHRAATARMAGHGRRLGAGGRGEARRRRVRLHRRRRRGGGDDAREPRGVPRWRAASAHAGRQRRSRPLGRGARPALACAVPARADRRALDRTRGGRGRASARAAASSGVPMVALERGDALDRGGRRATGRAALVSALLGERPRDLRELRARAEARATERSSSRSTRSRSAGGRATCARPTCRSSRARAAAQYFSDPVFLRAARQAAGGGPADGGGDDARDVPEPRPRPGTTSTGCARRPRCRCSSRACSPPRTRGARSSTGSTA